MSIITIGSLIASGVKGIPKLIEVAKKYKNKKRKSKLELENENLDFIAINLTGHPLSKEAQQKINKWSENSKILSKSIPTMDEEIGNVVDKTSEIILELIEEDRVLNNVLTGKYVLILSGLTSMTTTMTTIFHALSGHFPKMCFPKKADFGYTITDPFDFQSLRLEFRNVR